MKNKKTVSVDEWIDINFTSAVKMPDNAITVDMVMAKTKMSKSNAINRLNDLARSGKLKKGKFLKEGKLFNYYIPVEQ